jgi:glycosyltransferase involved in cell wall biosynthesis
MSRVLIVSPAYNEAAGLPEFVAAIAALRASWRGRHELRLLIVDDGSTDGTLDVLRALTRANSDWVSYLGFAANAGHQTALIAGLRHAGLWPDAVVTMDSDLEHPIEMVTPMIEAWEQQRAVVVQAQRRASSELAWTKRWPSHAFYRLASFLTGLPLAPGHADFRLWDAAVLRGVGDYLAHVGSLRVFAAWLPGVKPIVEYQQRVRPGRQTRFTLRKNLELAAISIIRFSHLPLTAITVLGVIGLGFSLVYGTWVGIVSYQGRAVPGWSSTVLVVMTMGCLQLIAIGILASYLRHLVFARDLPPFIVRESRLLE